MNALFTIVPLQTMEKFIEKKFCDYSKEIGLLDTTTGDANPRACFSQRNLAKEKYYPKGIAFLQKMMEDIRSQRINMILITELSRLTRSIKDFAMLVEMLDELNCKIQSLKDNFDTTTAVGAFSMYLMANLAQFERKQIGERISANFLSHSKRGLYNGGSVPLGYKVSGNHDGKLELVEGEAEVVRDIFKTFLSEGTLASTAKALNTKKIQLTRLKVGGGKPRVGNVMLESLYKMLTNKMYLGIRVFQENGETKEVKAQWPAIINEDIFKRVGEILKNNKSRKKTAPNRYPYLLSGLLFCHCGHRLSGKSAHGNGGKIAYYDHSWASKIQSSIKEKALNCDPQRVLANKLEPIVWKAVTDFLLIPEFFTEILLEAKSQSEISTPKKEIERKQNKIYEINMQLDSLSERLGLLPKAVNPKHVFDQMEKLSNQKQSLEGSIKDLRSNSAESRIPVEISDFEIFRKQIKELLENSADPQVKTTIIQKVIHKIIIIKETVEIYFIVGEIHYKRELAICASSRPHPTLLQNSPKKHTSPLPVFHGNLETSNLLHLKPKNIYDAGSNSLKNGGLRRN